MSKRPLRPWEVLLYSAADELSGLLIFAMVVFSPWAFGTTQAWSKWAMNGGGYLLGALLGTKLFLRACRGYHPERCAPCPGAQPRTPATARGLVAILASISLLLLMYCLVSALNARANYLPTALSFTYHDFIPWLPHSLDSDSTWRAFWNYLALGLSFWAIRDWLLGNPAAKRKIWRIRPQEELSQLQGSGPLPGRFRLLLWVLALNGLCLALEGIAQRLEGSGHLLFLVKPRVNPAAITQFGPWAYRGNAASYFNLLWPVCLGFWWTLNKVRDGTAHHLLLLCAAAMAACPIISTSRGGALVTIAMLAAGVALLAGTELRSSRWGLKQGKQQVLTMGLIFLFAASALGLGLSAGWKSLRPRMGVLTENLQLREAMFDSARPMARDYPVFGTGPGTFTTVFRLYRISTQTYYPAQLHNDWLETRITFGWVGSGLIALAGLLILVRWFIPGGVYAGPRFVLLSWLALGGCLLHARWDFPFQIHSIVFLVLLLCSMLFCFSRKPL